MKKTNFDIFVKLIAILATAYFLYILTIIADNLGNGRYQFKTDSTLILDTKTGNLFYNEGGELIEIK